MRSPLPMNRGSREMVAKKTINIESNGGLAATIGMGGKSGEQIKGRKLAPGDRRVLQGDNGQRVGQLRERPEKRQKHIPAPVTVVVNECEGFQGGGGDTCPLPHGVWLYCINGPGPMGFGSWEMGKHVSWEGATDSLGWALKGPQVSLRFSLLQ